MFPLIPDNARKFPLFHFYNLHRTDTLAYIFRKPKSRFWWVGYAAEGKPVQKSLKVTAKDAARVLLNEYQNREAKHYNRSKALIIKKDIGEIIVEYAASKGRNKTRNWYAWCGKRFVDYCHTAGISMVSDIHINTVEGFYQGLRSRGNEKERKRMEKNNGVGSPKRDPGGAASILRGVKAILNYAVKKDYIPDSPAKHVKADKPVKKLFRDISFDDMDKLLSAAKGSPFHVIFATAYYAGLREGELIYLRPADVDFKQNYLDVKSKTENLIKDHQERRIPLNAKLKEILQKHSSGKVWMFETQEGRPRKHNLNRELKRIAKRVGVNTDGLNMRVLRETFGSHLRRHGVDIALVSQYMGHSSIDVTLRHYAHIRIEQTHKEIDLL